MPLFAVTKITLSPIDQTNFATEKGLQKLIENNLESVFGCRIVATEFSTGPSHAGRIDTLALSEDHNPVIIEYKKVESSELINQSLFYLSWIQDHQGDFEIAVQNSLGKAEVDWSDIRVICLAPNYKKYDLHAVQVMGVDLELWTYRLFENGSIYLEEVFQKSLATAHSSSPSGNGLTVGQKEPGSYTVEQHFTNKPSALKSWRGRSRSSSSDSTQRLRKSQRSTTLPTKSHRTLYVWGSIKTEWASTSSLIQRKSMHRKNLPAET